MVVWAIGRVVVGCVAWFARGWVDDPAPVSSMTRLAVLGAALAVVVFEAVRFSRGGVVGNSDVMSELSARVCCSWHGLVWVWPLELAWLGGWCRPAGPGLAPWRCESLFLGSPAGQWEEVG